MKYIATTYLHGKPWGKYVLDPSEDPMKAHICRMVWNLAATGTKVTIECVPAASASE